MSPWERLLTLPLMELEASTVANWRLRGLPSGSLDVPECSVILTSSDDAERFDLAMLKTATTQNRDKTEPTTRITPGAKWLFATVDTAKVGSWSCRLSPG